MKLKYIILSVVSIVMWTMNLSHALEPVTSTLAVGFAFVASFGFAGYEYFIKCRLEECCNKRWIRQEVNGTELSEFFSERLYGQHLAVSSIIKHVKAHLHNANPSKALALSLHGGTGTGKNFISQIIASYVFKKGMDSSYVHLISAAKEYPHSTPEYITKYKSELKDLIERRIARCDRSLFIFDEIDKMPAGVIDVIKPYLEYYDKLDGVTYRRAMFFFLSNTAGRAITEFTWKHFLSGKDRESIRLKDLEETIARAALNADNKAGLWHSEVITKNVVTAFIPFLPLEKSHVRNCTRDMMLAKNFTMTDVTKNTEEVLDQLAYFPPNEQRFSTTGCKRIAEKIDLVMEDDF